MLALLLLALAIAPERWIVRLADGPVHRGLAREAPGGFELLRDGRWTFVAEKGVVRAVRESEVLADLAARRKAAGDDLALRVQTAAFALDEGLLAESIAEIDAVLEADPDQSAARRFIASAPLALTLPGSAARSLPERLVLFGARATPAYRELAAARMAASPREELAPVLARALASPSASVRAFGAFACRRIDPGAEADLLVRRTVLDSSPRVRIEAARALRDASDDLLAQRVGSALELPDARMRVSAAEALGVMGYRSAIPALVARLSALASGSHPGGSRGHIYVGNQVAYIQDFNPEIAQAASIGDPIVNVVEEATVLDARVGGTSTQTIQLEGPTLCRALARLSGEKLPEKPSVWLDWWKRNSSRFGPDSPSASPRTPTTGD